MARRLCCKNCGKIAALEDAGSNWRMLGRRNGRTMVACDCGHGLYVGIFGNTHASPEEVEHQKSQMRVAGLDPDRKSPTTGDIKKAMLQAPPGDTNFAVGDRVIHPVLHQGTVREVVEIGGEITLRITFDEEPDELMDIEPVSGKVRKIESDD